ncbi:4'-phosphopantetheinyl transferase superfamily [Trema orientale]|uniref:holo-[acyl-carrier-protein] synthase n=1 Tax=Trema orientale TaxID=63057 RepID=A0A2P5AVB5_TREOI|nr:4'-phosphopantetheinyl transferase superfamily [Trema orientale]
MNVHCFQRSFSLASSSLAPLQLPSPMETHFWHVLPDEVRSQSLMNQYFELLSPCEKDNVLSMRGDQLKKSALLARALVRTTIARYVDQTNSRVDPKSLKFRKNSYGKPEVDWQTADWQPPPLHFNISHTSSLIACGVTADAPIGIDVEEKNRKIKTNVLAFARRYFSSHELEHLAAITDAEIQRQEFMKLWTLKEAFVKALGRGFSASPFNTFTIRFKLAITKGESHLFKDTDNKVSEIVVESFDNPSILTSNWQFALMDLAGSHYAAICMENAKFIEGSGHVPMKLTVRRTIPLVEDEQITGTDSVVAIGGLT